MNYLSHYYLDQDSSDPYLLLGNILPDLFRVGDRKRRMPEQGVSDFSNAKHRALQAGVNKHHLVDRLFHNSLFFHKYSQALSKELRKAELAGMPRFQHFYGHILLEILIDKSLLNENPKLVADFYNLLNAIDQNEVSEFLKIKDLHQYFDSFHENFDAFMKHRFLELYLPQGGVVRATTQFAKRMHNYDLSDTEDQTKLQSVVDIGMSMIKKDYPKIFKTISDLCERDEIS